MIPLPIFAQKNINGIKIPLYQIHNEIMISLHKTHKGIVISLRTNFSPYTQHNWDFVIFIHNKIKIWLFKFFFITTE